MNHEEQKTEKPKDRRRARSLLFSPKMQLKYGMYYMGFGLVTVIVANFFLIYILVQLVNMGNQADPGTQVSGMLVSTKHSASGPGLHRDLSSAAGVFPGHD